VWGGGGLRISGPNLRPKWVHIDNFGTDVCLCCLARLTFLSVQTRSDVHYCNIPGCEARNRENTEACIAFMHRKSGKFSRF
jgi:hypothetical protein